MFCSIIKKIFVAERHLETLYILVGQVGKKNPLSQLDNEKIMTFNANEGKVLFSRSAIECFG